MALFLCIPRPREVVTGAPSLTGGDDGRVPPRITGTRRQSFEKSPRLALGGLIALRQLQVALPVRQVQCGACLARG